MSQLAPVRRGPGKTLSSLPDLGFTMGTDRDKPVPGLGPSKRAQTALGLQRKDLNSADGGTEGKDPDRLPSARDGGGAGGAHFARMKVAELKARMADMDKDLETQNLVRKQRDMKVQRVMNDMGQVEPALNNMNQKIVDMNDTVKGVKRDIILQMDSQATMRKELMVVLEDKTKGIKTSLSTDIDILKDHFKGISSRLRKLEDAQSGGGDVDELKQRIVTMDNYNMRVGQRLAELSKDIESSKLKAQQDQETMSNRLTQQMGHMTATVDADRQARERDSRRLEEALKAKWDDTESLVQNTKHELERAVDNLGSKTRDQFGDFKEALDLVSRNLKDTEGNMKVKMTEELFALDHKINAEMQRRDYEQTKAVRLLEDKMHTLTQTVERNVESSSVSIRKVHDGLQQEQTEREQFEESMMRLVDDQLMKLHMGIERHPNVDSEI